MSEIRTQWVADGLDVVIHLDATEAAAVAADADMLAGWLGDVIDAMTDLRLGTWADDPDRGRAGTAAAVAAIHHRLTPRLRGVLDAAVRAHRAAGGSVRHLQEAMDAPHPSGAQYARDRLPDTPGVWERWATGTLHDPAESTDTASTTTQGDDDMRPVIISATNIVSGNARVGRQIGGNDLGVNGRRRECPVCGPDTRWGSVDMVAGHVEAYCQGCHITRTFR